MWTLVERAAGWGAQRAWEVVAVGEEVGRAKVQPPDPVALTEVLMILATDLREYVPLRWNCLPSFAKFASRVDKVSLPTADLFAWMDRHQLCSLKCWCPVAMA